MIDPVPTDAETVEGFALGLDARGFEAEAATLRALLNERRRMAEALAVSAKVCGHNNCNCPGAAQVKAAVSAAIGG